MPHIGWDNGTRNKPTHVQVRYGEVDRMGLLYHVNYYEYFEWARSDWIRNFWRPYKEIEDDGYALVVIEGHIHYHSPAYYDDRLEVTMDVIDWGRSRIRFSYAICREGESEPLCTGSTSHCFIRDGKPVRLPDEFVKLLDKAFSIL
ncbi:MAG: thioesterase family protein [Candidatus Electryoneaceae bacterium]|nr:thioesterase family protein [Candidatus Electryoneaceae bacterium]